MNKWLIVFVLVLLAVGNTFAQSTTSTTLRFIWQSNTETDLEGYGLYSGSVEGTYDVHIDLDIPTSSTAEVTYSANSILVNTNEPTYFVVDAFNTAGNRSGFSNVVSYIHCVPEPEETQTIPCGTGYTGTKVQKRISTCSFNSLPVWGNWVDVSNTCVAQIVCVPLPAETQTLSCQEGYTGIITQERTSSCPTTYGTPVWSAWVQTSSTCTPICQPLPKETRTLSCSEGYSGSITEERTSTCPGPVWSNWVQTNSTCVALPVCKTSTETRDAGTCGTGFTGNVVERRTSTCASTYATPVFGPWVADRSACVALPVCKTSTETRDGGSCGTGYSGNVIERRTSTCADPYAAPVWGAWIADRAACVALVPCKPLADNVVTASCGEGYSGSIVTTTKSTCPDPYGQPVWLSPTVVNTCVALPLCVAPAPESRTLSCPPGQTGNIIETRTSSCPDKYGTPITGAWAQTSNTCTVVSDCVPITKTRTVRCLKWYEKGFVTQQSTSVCNADGTSTPGPWTVISSTCRPWWKR